ncbi:MAG: hypothetical protein RLZZ383_1381 [Pseudomonadota bacterium]
MSLTLHGATWDRACTELAAQCPVMARLIADGPGERLTSHGEAYVTLARSIVGQQISVKAAATIWGRFEAAVGEMTPASVLAAPEETLRGAGLSASKVRYLRALSAYADAGHLDVAALASMDDEGIVRNLVALPGIGRWTAEMFLIFHLLRADVFPLGDIGLLAAVRQHLTDLPEGTKLTPKQADAIGERWKPWRTVATWWLWRSLDPLPVAY